MITSDFEREAKSYRLKIVYSAVSHPSTLLDAQNAVNLTTNQSVIERR